MLVNSCVCYVFMISIHHSSFSLMALFCVNGKLVYISYMFLLISGIVVGSYGF